MIVSNPLIRIKTNKNFSFFAGVIIALLVLQFTHVAIVGEYIGSELVSIVVLFLGSCFVISKLGINIRENTVLFFYIGYIIRVLLIFSKVYMGGVLNFFVLSCDAEAFFVTAEAYFNGIFTSNYTRYPYFLYVLFKIFGLNRFVAQYVNVLVWFVGGLLIKRISNGLPKRVTRIAVLFYSLLPIGIFMTSELLRESLLMILVMYSFYHQYLWMERGHSIELVRSLFFALLGMLLHTVCIAMVASAMILVLFWEPRNKKIKVTKRKVIYFGMLCMIGVVVICSGILWRLDYFSMAGNGLSVQTITGYSFASGGSDYLQNVRNMSSVVPFVFWTVIRCIYFWLSPMIWDIRSSKDIIAIAMDAIPLMYFLYLVLKKKKGICLEYRFGVMTLIIFTLIYAWGTSNAGTAMRHRNMLVGLMVLTYLIKEKNKTQGRTL